jgi:hypothetical protein
MWRNIPMTRQAPGRPGTNPAGSRKTHPMSGQNRPKAAITGQGPHGEGGSAAFTPAPAPRNASTSAKRLARLPESRGTRGARRRLPETGGCKAQGCEAPAAAAGGAAAGKHNRTRASASGPWRPQAPRSARETQQGGRPKAAISGHSHSRCVPRTLRLALCASPGRRPKPPTPGPQSIGNRKSTNRKPEVRVIRNRRTDPPVKTGQKRTSR